MERYPRTAPSACIWMQAGVVRNKPCFKDFLCRDCRFDLALNRICRANRAARENGEALLGRAGQLVSWQEKLRRMPPAKRPCIHHMKGRIDYKACPRSYRCANCEFDQYFQDRFRVYAAMAPVDFERVKGVSVPSGYYLSRGHTWISLMDENGVRLGIDAFASRLLGRFDNISAPLMGKPIEKGKPAFTLCRGGNAVTFWSPVSGVVTEVNTHVRRSPGRVARAPYTGGWVLALSCADLKKELKAMMFMETAVRFIDRSVRALYDFLETRTGIQAADGGDLVDDIYGSLPGVPWGELVNRFIHCDPGSPGRP